MTPEIVGYFSWTTRNGRISCEKCDADIRKGQMPESIKRRQEEAVPGNEHPLDATQWKMTLEQLAALYPLVIHNKAVDLRQ